MVVPFLPSSQQGGDFDVHRFLCDMLQLLHAYWHNPALWLHLLEMLRILSLLDYRASRKSLSSDVDVLEVLDKQHHPIVFMLWGNSARKLKKLLHNPSHLILESVHPSPLAANHGGWFKNNHFRLANEYLKKNKIKPVDWIK